MMFIFFWHLKMIQETSDAIGFRIEPQGKSPSWWSDTVTLLDNIGSCSGRLLGKCPAHFEPVACIPSLSG
jgi:hypothetical protein